MDERAPSPHPRLQEPSRRFAGSRRLARSERGTAVVEFALIAPLLFLLVFGIIEFGRVLNAYNQMTQLAGQGARAAAVNRNPDGTPVAAGNPPGTVDPNCQGTQYSIQCQLADYYAEKDALSDVKVCIPSLPSAIGSPVTVHVTYRYSFTVGLFGFAHLNLSATQTERAEALPGGSGYVAGSYQNGVTSPSCT
jgi:Flp pilus assembly protein TadG